MKTKIRYCANTHMLALDTDFDLQKYPDLEEVVMQINGVEWSVCKWDLHKYNTLIEFGELFNREEMAIKVSKAISDYFYRKENIRVTETFDLTHVPPYEPRESVFGYR